MSQLLGKSFSPSAEGRKIHSAYVAGIIDGEGCLSISRVPQGVSCRIDVTNTSLELILSLQKEFGGGVYTLNQHSSRAKSCYSWRLNGLRCLYLLREALPYLIVKRRQAELLVEFIGLDKSKRSSLAQPLIDQIRELNKRGV